MSLYPIQRALVMDEDSSTRLLTTESLKAFGVHHVEDYATESLALQRFRRGGFDLAIFDLRIWTSPVAADGPTLVVATSPKSAADESVIFLNAQRLGADTLVEKPFTRWMLLHRLEALLKTPAARRLKIVELSTVRFRLRLGKDERF